MSEITKKLLDSVNETARIARTSLLLFLVVALYLLIIVGTTTDLMLLRGEIVALPLMEVGVPVVAFYIVAPLIFLLLHSNLLLRLRQLTETIKQWKANSKGLKDNHSSLVFPLDFARLLLDGKPRWALYGGFYSIIVLLPIVVLLALQMSFLAYQSSGITFWHQLIVTFDLMLLFSFVCFVIGTREGRKVERNYVLKMLFQMRGTVFSAGLVLILAWTIAVVPNGWQETMGIFVAMLVGLFFLLRFYVSKYLRNKQDNELNDFFLPTKHIVLYGVILLSFLGIVAIAVDSSQERFIQRQLSAWVFADWWKEYSITSYRPVRRFLNVAEQSIALKEAPPEIVGALIIKETKLKGEEVKFKGEEAKFDPLCKYIGELDLSGRQLNYALFYGPQFSCVKLESAELYGADLKKAELHGADLSKVNLSEAKLHGADLYNTKLHGANLYKVKLHGADLFEAELHGANLYKAELHGANLSEAELRGADLYKAELHGANLYKAELHGVNLYKAELHSANLYKAELHGANLYKAQLHGANLYKAQLHGANLVGAELYGAYLYGAELHGADLRWVELYGSDLGDVILKNTDLSGVRWDKPKYWVNIINSIGDSLKERGLKDDDINKAVSRIKDIESTEFGFIPPTIPIATDCVVHSGQGPFKEWPVPAEGCDLKLASSLADLACQNQWTAKGIVNRVINKKRIANLIKASGIENRDTNEKSIADFIKTLNILRIVATPSKEDINLIKALHNKGCLILKPYRKVLNDKYEELNQQRISE